MPKRELIDIERRYMGDAGEGTVGKCSVCHEEVRFAEAAWWHPKCRCGWWSEWTEYRFEPFNQVD